MRLSFDVRKPLVAMQAGLAGAALVLALGLAQPAQAMTTVQDLFESIYVEQICSGHEFSEPEWSKLVDRVRTLSASGYEGEGTLFTMVRAKSSAKRLTIQNQCSAPEVAKLRDIFNQDLKSAL